MEFPADQYPQITYQYVRPGTPLGAGSGYSHATKVIHDLREQRKLEMSNVPSSTESSTEHLIPQWGETTTELPAINPTEMKPTHARISRQNSQDFKLDEIQFKYGVAGYLAATFSLRFDEEGKPAELVFDPYADGERIIRPGSAEYEIRIAELKDLIATCQDDPKSYTGVEYTGIKGGVVEQTIEADHHNAATQALTAIDRGITRPFDR